MASAAVLQLKRKPQPVEINLDDILASAAKPQAKAASKTPVLTVSTAIQKNVLRLREIAGQIESLEAEQGLLQVELVSSVEPARSKLMESSGYLSSVKVPDGNGLSATVTWSTRFSKVSLEAQEPIREIVGDEYDNFFQKEMEIKVKDVSESSLKELIASVGAEQFARFFAVDRWVMPTERYAKEGWKVFTAKQREQLSTFLKPYKSSVKVK